mmetsp:Transcript_27479/g.49978  ORF Transcript_27479/g.49978 Transcript_27479/m.49978 type:complete len:207 (-) Transcript_27479:1340-1960(-)
MARLQIIKIVSGHCFPSSLEVRPSASGCGRRTDRRHLGRQCRRGSGHQSPHPKVIDQDIAPLQLKSEFAMVLLHESLCVRKLRAGIMFALFDHDGVVCSFIAHVQILFNHNGLLRVSLFHERGTSFFRLLFEAHFSCRRRWVLVFIKTTGVVFSNGIHLLCWFLLFYYSICHGQSIRRENATIAMDVHFSNSKCSRHGACMLWSSA